MSERTVANWLPQLDYSLQSNRKTHRRRPASGPGRPVPAHHHEVTKFQRQGQPVVSVDTKKKELVGDFKNGGREWQPAGRARGGEGARLLDEELGKAIPYGVYDMTANTGWVSVGIDHDTAEFAVETHPPLVARDGAADVRPSQAAADHGRRRRQQRSRCRLWKVELQKLADETGLQVQVCHFPPGTSKWNKIEHRMFCHITENWRGRPLVSREVVVNLIGGVTTDQGLRVRAALDENTYEPGIKVSDADLAAINSSATNSTGSGTIASRQECLANVAKCSTYFC